MNSKSSYENIDNNIIKLKSDVNALDMIMHHIEINSASMSITELTDKLDIIYLMYNEALEFYNSIDNKSNQKIKKYEIRLNNIYNRIETIKEICILDNDLSI